MGILKILPLKNLVPIFIVSFSLFFVIFFVVEPAFYCEEGGGCVLGDPGNFILGVMVAGALFLLDMGILYMTLMEFLVPKAPSEE